MTMSEPQVSVTPQAEVAAPTAAPETAAPETAAPAQDKSWQEKRAEFASGELEPPDPAKETPSEEQAKQEKYSQSFAALRKKEVALTRAQQALKSEQAQWAETKTFLDGFQKNLSTDPVTALRGLATKAGVPFHELYSAVTRAILQDGEPPDPAEVAKKTTQEQLEAWKAEQDAARQAQELESKKQMLQQAHAEILQDLRDVLRQGEYPFSQAEDPDTVANAALHVMVVKFKTNQSQISCEEALAEVEQEISARYRRWQEAEARAKAKSREPNPTPSGAQVNKPQGEQAARPRTISHSHIQETGPQREPDWREKRERFLRGG